VDRLGVVRGLEEERGAGMMGRRSPTIYTVIYLKAIQI